MFSKRLQNVGSWNAIIQNANHFDEWIHGCDVQRFPHLKKVNEAHNNDDDERFD